MDKGTGRRWRGVAGAVLAAPTAAGCASSDAALANSKVIQAEPAIDAVKNLLVAKGISPDRIVAKGYGSQYPRIANDTAAGRQQNRRVEVPVLNEGVSAQSATR